MTSVHFSGVEQKRKTDNIQREGNGNNTNVAANESFQPLLKSPRSHPNSSRKIHEIHQKSNCEISKNKIDKMLVVCIHI